MERHTNMTSEDVWEWYMSDGFVAYAEDKNGDHPGRPLHRYAHARENIERGNQPPEWVQKKIASYCARHKAQAHRDNDRGYMWRSYTFGKNWAGLLCWGVIPWRDPVLTLNDSPSRETVLEAYREYNE